MPTKPKLIIIHSFPTNSILLEGFYAFLSDCFIVYPIDLPGFCPDVPPLTHISIQGYIDYVNAYIQGLDLDAFFLAGVSFGFLIANGCPFDPKCRGIIAFEPCINAGLLRHTRYERIMYQLAFNCIVGMKLHKYIYTLPGFKKYLSRKGPKERIEILLQTIDPYTLFATARCIFETGDMIPSFHPIPYLIVINPDDDTIDATKILHICTQYIADITVVTTTIDHHPTDMSKAYFMSHITLENIDVLKKFIS